MGTGAIRRDGMMLRAKERRLMSWWRRMSKGCLARIVRDH